MAKTTRKKLKRSKKMSEENEKKIEKFCVGQELTHFYDAILDKKNKFEQYFLNLVDWNKKFNLTTITSRDEVFEKHFLDSILSMEIIPQNASIIDIGAGAGFPSFPLKIVRDDLKIFAVDSVNKKITFLKDLVDSLSLKNVTCLHARAEDLAQKDGFRENFDVCVARAVASLNTLCEYCLPFVKVGGYFLAYKSQNLEDELLASKNALKMLGGKLEKVLQFDLNGAKRYIVAIKKIVETPKKFPRGKNKPRLEPLS